MEETKNQPAAIETGKQTAEMTSGRIVNVDIKHGSNLYFACGSCHGDQAQGNKTLNAPALNVQEDWYMVRQLKKIQRRNSGYESEGRAGDANAADGLNP